MEAHATVRQAYRVLDAHPGREDRASPSEGRRRRTLWVRAAETGGAAVDRLTLRVMEQLFVSGDRPNLRGDVRARIEQGRAKYCSTELLAHPESYFRQHEAPREISTRELDRVDGGRRVSLRFASPYETYDPTYDDEYNSFVANRRCAVRLWLHDEPAKTTVICIHTWCGGSLWIEEQLFGVQTLFRDGHDIALFTMPFHGSRTPSQAKFSGQLFPSRDVRRSNEAFGQAVADLRVLMRWLRDHGRQDVGVIGISLGGYTTALMASLDPSLAFAVPIAAPCSFADILWHHGAGHAGRIQAEKAGITKWDLRSLWAVHCPLFHSLKIPQERVLMLWGEGDRIVPKVHQLALWEHWGRPEIRSFPGGHLLQIGRRGYLRHLRRWLRER